MDDFSRLEQKLAKLRQRDRAPGEARVLRGSEDQLIAAILTEVDETILPRRLSFSKESGEALHLAVGNRRLQAMVAPAPSVDGSEKVANVALKSVEDDAVMALRDVIASFVGAGDDLTVASARFEDLSPPSDVGVPVDQLKEAWGLASVVGAAGSPTVVLRGLLDSFGDRADGWLLIEGEEVAAQGGDESVVSALSESAAIFLDGYFGKKTELLDEGSGVFGLVFSAQDGTTVLFVDAGDAMAFVRSEAVAAYGIAREWQQVSAL